MPRKLLWLLPLVLASMWLGLWLGETYVIKPQIIIEYIILPPETRVVGIIRQVEVIKEVPVKLKDFESIGQLREFLDQDDTDSRLVAKGVIYLQGSCEDRALQLQNRAMDAGYKMSIQVLGKLYNNDGQYYFVGRLHAICSVIIGNEFIFIEPSTDECWIGAYLD